MALRSLTGPKPVGEKLSRLRPDHFRPLLPDQHDLVAVAAILASMASNVDSDLFISQFSQLCGRQPFDCPLAREVEELFEAIEL
jgi:hypothetical protein